MSVLETIVAPATPKGEGAVSIIRLSGPAALCIARELVRYRGGQSHQLRRAEFLRSDGSVLDDGMICEMHGPKSYTGEDVVELFPHGSPTVVEASLQRCIDAGARLARPGEFTERAFLNGRMSLDQAEAVMDIIQAAHDGALRFAQAQLKGRLRAHIENLLDPLERMLADYRAALDFPEFPTGDGAHPHHREIREKTLAGIHALIEHTVAGAFEKPKVVLCGAPNVGKSSLLNALLNEDRVIVDASAGTTRDAVAIDLKLGGRKLELWDTAGQRADAGRIEARGIEHAQKKMDEATLNLWLVAADMPVWPDSNNLDVLFSKVDLVDETKMDRLMTEAATRGFSVFAKVSCHTKVGLGQLQKTLEKRLRIDFDPEHTVVVSKRHLEALQEARTALLQFEEQREFGQTLDVLSLELEACAKALGRVIGRDVESDVLDAIFKQFCIGK